MQELGVTKEEGYIHHGENKAILEGNMSMLALNDMNQLDL